MPETSLTLIWLWIFPGGVYAFHYFLIDSPSPIHFPRPSSICLRGSPGPASQGHLHATLVRGNRRRRLKNVSSNFCLFLDYFENGSSLNCLYHFHIICFCVFMKMWSRVLRHLLEDQFRLNIFPFPFNFGMFNQAFWIELHFKSLFQISLTHQINCLNIET